MRKIILASILGAWAPAALWADVKMPAIFGDHMVLQQGMPLPVWGNADPGEQVKVSFAGKETAVTADGEGNWQLKLDPLKASEDSREMTVSGKNKLIFTDVLVGEVWACTGQSNMVASQRNLVSEEVGSKKLIRFFITPLVSRVEPHKDTTGKWVVCVPQPGFENAYSAVGYYFADDIQKNRRVPVGMIQAAWGGTSIQPWIDLETFRKSEEFKRNATQVDGLRAKIPELVARYEKEILPAWEEKHKQWELKKGGAKPEATAETTPAGAAEEGGVEAAKPKVNEPEPKRPPYPAGDGKVDTSIFNGMVYPHIPYAIRGVLWYQGESNAQNEERSVEYAKLLPLLISGWREKWQQGDFPFYIVQLPAFTVDRPWTTLRNSQFKALSVPNTAMAVTLDLNPTDNLHPPRKEGVGQRLALLARKNVYGEEIVASGPVYQSMKIEGNKIRIAFSEIGGGLVLGGPPKNYLSPKNDVSAEKTLVGFQICGTDGAWVPASALIEGNSVLVWSDTVTAPVNVSYAWANYPKANLYNKEGLPAGPFRSDDLPEFLKGK